MHAIKGGWVGQTFALAKFNDSGGKKARIRRSKEERKAMVESFIKKYQKLNNGNFPSLNLTHKEVGGSFYTVREIVREVIQENRVLGPAKLSSEDQSSDRFLELYPLGSVSIEPETDSSSSNESHIVNHILPNHRQDTSEELVLNSSMQFLEPEYQRLDEGQILNGSSQAVEKNEECDKAKYTESRASESLELEENVAELEGSKAEATHVATDITVETFPLISGSRIPYGLDEESSEYSELTGILVEKETEKVELEAGNYNPAVGGMNFMERSSDLGNEKMEENLAGPLLEKSIDLLDEKPVGILEAPPLENSNDSTTKEGIIPDTNTGTDPEVKDVMVETFPLISGSRIAYGLDEESSEPSELTGTLVEKETENEKKEAGKNNFVVDGLNFLERSSDLVNEEAEGKLADPLLKTSVGILDEKPSGILEASPLENLNNSATKEGTILDTNTGTDPEVKDASPAVIEAIDTQSLNGTIASSSSEQSISTKAIVNENNPSIQRGDSSLKESKPTLDRMNLESWETRTEKSVKPQSEANLLLAFLKSLVEAFVKFWSE